MAYEQASVHLAQGRQKEDWYTSVLNPMEQVRRLKTPHTPRPPTTQNFPPQVPCLVFPDGRRLTQSMAILEWLEGAFPEPALLPEDSYLAARTRALAQIPNSYCQPLQNLSTLKAMKAHGCEMPDWARPHIEKAERSFLLAHPDPRDMRWAGFG